ncbi:hypothetical protein SAMN00777080_3526 [Aquiflexum balticum DSM 16537]|uniref:Uncharacterized protein n=1 Tax=Aquiflexum balticum DSM 16537 TaxID=758820 RepID=A0A1W2H7K2_9BACT|nr:hypothetical protein SAMN00777080_3526 [Aquiflexum balticum DSM 16537]
MIKSSGIEIKEPPISLQNVIQILPYYEKN